MSSGQAPRTPPKRTMPGSTTKAGGTHSPAESPPPFIASPLSPLSPHSPSTSSHPPSLPLSPALSGSSPLSSSVSNLDESFIVVPTDEHAERDGEADADLTDTETASTVSTAGLGLGLEGISDDSSSGTGGEDSLAGSMHEWIGGDGAGREPRADMANLFDRGIVPTRPRATSNMTLRSPAAASSLADSYIDAEAPDTDTLSGSFATHGFSARGRSQEHGSDSDAEADGEIDPDRTPGASQIVVIMPQLAASFSTTSSRSGGDSATPSGSTYGLLAPHKITEKGKQEGQGVPFRPFPKSPSSGGVGISPEGDRGSGTATVSHNDPATWEHDAKGGSTYSPFPKQARYRGLPTQRVSSNSDRVKGGIPDAWLADARIWAPHAEDLDGTRSEMPDYSMLASGESLLSTYNDSPGRLGSADAGGGKASRRMANEQEEQDAFGMTGFGAVRGRRKGYPPNKRPALVAASDDSGTVEPVQERGLEKGERRTSDNEQRLWDVVSMRDGAGKRWGLLALASIISVALLGSFGPQIPLPLSSFFSQTRVATTAPPAMNVIEHIPDTVRALGSAYTTAHNVPMGNDPAHTASRMRTTTCFAPMALATQLMPDLETIKSVIATLTASSSSYLDVGEPSKKDAGRSKYTLRERTEPSESDARAAATSAAALASANENARKQGQALGLSTRPADKAVAVSIAMPDNGYKAWARALRARITAQTAMIPAASKLPVVATPQTRRSPRSAPAYNASAMTTWLSLHRQIPLHALLASMSPLLNSSRHSIIVAGQWTRSVILAAFRPLVQALLEDYDRLCSLYVALVSPRQQGNGTSTMTTGMTVRAVFSPTTEALLAIGAHFGHIADAAAGRFKALHRSIVSFEDAREKQHAAAIDRIARELGKKWFDARDTVILGAKEEADKMLDVARGVKAYLEYVEGVSAEAAAKVGQQVKGSTAQVGSRVDEMAKDVKAKVSRAGEGFVRAVGSGFRRTAGAVVDLADSTHDHAALSGQNELEAGTVPAGQGDLSARVQLDKAGWWSWSRRGTGGAQRPARASRQGRSHAHHHAHPRRSTHTRHGHGPGREQERAVNRRGKRRDLSAAVTNGRSWARFEPHELARIREMWSEVKQGPRRKWRKMLDQVYHGIVPFVG